MQLCCARSQQRMGVFVMHICASISYLKQVQCILSEATASGSACRVSIHVSCQPVSALGRPPFPPGSFMRRLLGILPGDCSAGRSYSAGRLRCRRRGRVQSCRHGCWQRVALDVVAQRDQAAVALPRWLSRADAQLQCRDVLLCYLCLACQLRNHLQHNAQDG